MTHGPVDGLLAFWSGMQASIWIGNFPGDTFSEHRTWYILEERKRGKKFLFRITDLEDRRMANFTMMMRFLTFFFHVHCFPSSSFLGKLSRSTSKQLSLSALQWWVLGHIFDFPLLFSDMKMCLFHFIHAILHNTERCSSADWIESTKIRTKRPHTALSGAKEKNFSLACLCVFRGKIFSFHKYYASPEKSSFAIHLVPNKFIPLRVILNEWKIYYILSRQIFVMIILMKKGKTFSSQDASLSLKVLCFYWRLNATCRATGDKLCCSNGWRARGCLATNESQLLPLSYEMQ